MNTYVDPLAHFADLPAPVMRGPDGATRSLTIRVPQAIRFQDTLEGGATVSGELRMYEHRYELVRLEIQLDDLLQQLRPGIGPDDLRRVAIRRLIVTVARRHAQVVETVNGGRATKDLADALTDDEATVALWHIARACRDNPNPLIRDQLRLPSDQAAARRVAKLRKAGLLPPADKQGQRY